MATTCASVPSEGTMARRWPPSLYTPKAVRRGGAGPPSTSLCGMRPAADGTKTAWKLKSGSRPTNGASGCAKCSATMRSASAKKASRMLASYASLRKTRSMAAWAGPCERSVRTVSFLGARTLLLLAASVSDGWRALVSLLRLRLPLAVAAVAGLLAKKSSVSKNGTPMVSTARTQNTVNRSERLAGAIVHREPRSRQPRRAVVAMFPH